MGLAMVDKIVRRWSGRVEILSAPPARGTVFRVILPQGAPPPTPGEIAARLAAESDGAPAGVMLAGAGDGAGVAASDRPA